jgi:hypothetical protein
MLLTGEQKQMLRQAVLGAYPNPYDLKIFLSDQMDVQFTEIVRGDEYRHIVFDLIEKFQADGRLEEFITFIATILCRYFCCVNSES